VFDQQIDDLLFSRFQSVRWFNVHTEEAILNLFTKWIDSWVFDLYVRAHITSIHYTKSLGNIYFGIHVRFVYITDLDIDAFTS
jgi:hypothetical protein